MELKTSPVPTLELEKQLLNSGAKIIAGVDEVGRGALAGPVTVGIALLDGTNLEVPRKLKDSKLISKATRESLIPELKTWIKNYSIGHASALEIDEIGIVGALKLAFSRAYKSLLVKPNHVILDGKHNWLSEFNEFEVTTKIKADQHCAIVSAASVLAKVERDQLMAKADLEYPGYGLAKNVGYGSASHMDAIGKLGATQFHRRSWNLPTGNQ